MIKLYIKKNKAPYFDYAYLEPKDNCIEIPYFADKYSNICKLISFRYHLSEDGNFKTLYYPYFLSNFDKELSYLIFHKEYSNLEFNNFINDDDKLNARKIKNIKILSLNKELSFLKKETPSAEIYEKIKQKKNEIKIATSNAYKEFTRDFISNSIQIQSMFSKFGKPNFDFEQALYNEIHYGYMTKLFTNQVRIISIFD